jgi:hypothetical protein
MPVCPICGENVPALKTHQERAYAPKNPDAPVRYLTNGVWVEYEQ